MMDGSCTSWYAFHFICVVVLQLNFLYQNFIIPQTICLFEFFLFDVFLLLELTYFSITKLKSATFPRKHSVIVLASRP